MNDFERCKRNHPSYLGKEQRELAEMEERFNEDAQEPDYAVRRQKRGGRRKPRYPGVFWHR